MDQWVSGRKLLLACSKWRRVHVEEASKKSNPVTVQKMQSLSGATSKQEFMNGPAAALYHKIPSQNVARHC